MDICHIAPTPFLHDLLIDTYPTQLLLAHLVEEDETYVRFYREYSGWKILDNSAFEMYKRGLPMYESDKLLSMAEKVKANVIVMSDYPGQPSFMTESAAEELGPKFKDAGYQTFFVPQSEIGELYSYIDSWHWAAQSDLVDYIGMSILGVPNAFGNIEKDNKLQRYFARFQMFNILKAHGILDVIKANGKKIHLLGALDGWPGEIELLQPFHEYITSWDSSGAVWYGLHGQKTYDNSPTYQIDGKYEVEVDFNFDDNTSIRSSLITLARSNMKIVDDIAAGKTCSIRLRV